jgi:hypothetical protein
MDEPISIEQEAIAKWLSSYLYVHECEADWSKYLDEAKDILEVIERAKSGKGKVLKGYDAWIAQKPNGDLSSHATKDEALKVLS